VQAGNTLLLLTAPSFSTRLVNLSLFRRELRPTLALAFPIVVGQVGQMLIGLTDTALIGRLGTVPLAAAAFTHGIFTVFFLAGIGLLIPVGVYTARDYGAGDTSACVAWLRHGRALAWAVGLAFFALLAVLSTQLHRFGQPAEVIAVIGPFFLLISASLIPALLFQVQRQFAESLGRPWIPMIVMLGDVVFNAWLNWVLIWGHWGFPALGLVGSGLATLVARTLAVGVLGLFFQKAPTLAFARPKTRSPWSLDRFRMLMRMGIPTSAGLLFEAGLFAVAALLMGWLGAIELAAHHVALSCAGFTFMFPLGLATAVSMRVSRALGESQPTTARAIGLGGMAISAAAMTFFALAFMIIGEPVARAFSTDPAVITLAAQLLIVAALFQLFDGGQVVAVGALRGLGDVRIPTLITFVAYWLVSLPTAYVLAFHTPLRPLGVWIGLAAGLACTALLQSWRFHRQSMRVAKAGLSMPSV